MPTDTLIIIIIIITIIIIRSLIIFPGEKSSAPTYGSPCMHALENSDVSPVSITAMAGTCSCEKSASASHVEDITLHTSVSAGCITRSCIERSINIKYTPKGILRKSIKAWSYNLVEYLLVFEQCPRISSRLKTKCCKGLFIIRRGSLL